jgi:hypothetical protein
MAWEASSSPPLAVTHRLLVIKQQAMVRIIPLLAFVPVFISPKFISHVINLA